MYDFDPTLKKTFKTKNDIVSELSNRTGFTKKDIESVYSALEDIMIESLYTCGEFRIGPVWAGAKVYPEKRCYDPTRSKFFVKPEHYILSARIIREHKIRFRKFQSDNEMLEID